VAAGPARRLNALHIICLLPNAIVPSD
jgi:hypothetical protein